MTIDGYLALAGPAIGVVLVGFAEGLGAAKTYAARSGYDVDANKELGGMGVANLGAGLCAGMVVNGSLSKTAVNGGAGASRRCPGCPWPCWPSSPCSSPPGSSSSSRRPPSARSSSPR